MTDIPIDTEDYERRFGKPAGRAFWKFRIVSADPAIRDHVRSLFRRHAVRRANSPGCAGLRSV
jgi:hypothetical protein